jgi:hypothetical protein
MIVCDEVGSFQNSAVLASSSSLAMRLRLPATSKTLHQPGNLGVEFREVILEVVHSHLNVILNEDAER